MAKSSSSTKAETYADAQVFALRDRLHADIAKHATAAGLPLPQILLEHLANNCCYGIRKAVERAFAAGETAEAEEWRDLPLATGE